MRVLGLIWTVLWGLGAVFFGLFYYIWYWIWRDCFNEAGRCFDPVDSVVHHEQSEVLIVPFAICLLLAVTGAVVTFRRAKTADRPSMG